MPVFVLENPPPAPSNLLLGFRAKPYSLDGFKLETTQVKTRSAAEQHGFQNAINGFQRSMRASGCLSATRWIH